MEIITSRRNPMCLHVKKLGASRSYREEHRQFLCDGEKLLEEAVRSGTAVEAIITSAILPDTLSAGSRVYYTDQSLIDSLSPLKNAQNTLFICSMPPAGFTFQKGTHILLDGVQDPGNVGAVVRSASAFGISTVILTDKSADPYNPKAVRASMGSLFRQHTHAVNVSELAGIKQSLDAVLIGASLDSNDTDITEINLQNSIVAIGNEGSGLSDEVKALCDISIRIPISPQCESLNAAVAASIMMWEAVRGKAMKGMD